MICSVTAVSPSNRVQRHLFDWSVILSPVVILNLVLICLSGVAFAYYIAGVNAVASEEYHISAERNKIAKLIEAQSLLAAEKSATENPVAAATFAQAQKMTEAKDIIYVFENNNVALRQ